MTLTTAIIVFLVATLVIGFAGSRLARVADQLADLTGWGEALFGALFLGGITSLPGIITSVVSAWEGHPQLAVSNAVGGIAAQTFFLGIADLFYRKINLEHASASLANLMQGVLLMILLGLLMVGYAQPSFSIFHIHPLSILILFLYIFGSRMISKAASNPMWAPKSTRETVEDIPEEETMSKLNLRKTSIQFAVLAVLVGAGGYAVAQAGMSIARQTPLSDGVVGALFTAVATSLPELIVSVSAVRQKALNLAVANIIGGNSFDVLFVAFADLAFLEGSIFKSIGSEQVFTISLTLVMTATLIMGLLDRQKRGIGGIGWESASIIALYLLGNLLLFWG